VGTPRYMRGNANDSHLRLRMTLIWAYPRGQMRMISIWE